MHYDRTTLFRCLGHVSGTGRYISGALDDEDAMSKELKEHLQKMADGCTERLKEVESRLADLHEARDRIIQQRNEHLERINQLMEKP